MTSPTALRAPRYGSLTPVRLRRRAGGVDWLLIAAAAALCLAGALSVYAATRNGLRAQGRNPAGYLVRDLVNIAVGAALAFPVFMATTAGCAPSPRCSTRRSARRCSSC